MADNTLLPTAKNGKFFGMATAAQIAASNGKLTLMTLDAVHAVKLEVAKAALKKSKEIAAEEAAATKAPEAVGAKPEDVRRKPEAKKAE